MPSKVPVTRAFCFPLPSFFVGPYYHTALEVFFFIIDFRPKKKGSSSFVPSLRTVPQDIKTCPARLTAPKPRLHCHWPSPPPFWRSPRIPVPASGAVVPKKGLRRRREFYVFSSVVTVYIDEKCNRITRRRVAFATTLVSFGRRLATPHGD